MADKEFSFALSAEDSKVIKGVAICLMLWHHLFLSALYSGDSSVVVYIARLGKVCVSLFLLLSGYGLSKQYSEYDIRITRFWGSLLDTFKFLLRRFIKFYTNYWFIFIIFVPISIFVFNRPFSTPYGENVSIFKYVLLDLLGVLWGRSYNITWWFNSLIVLLYVLFPFLFLLCRRVPFLCFIITLLLVPYGDALHIAYRGINRWVFPFCAGIIWASHSKKITEWVNKFNKKILIVIFLLFTILFSFLRLYDESLSWGGSNVDGLIALGISLLVVFIQHNKNLFYRVLNFLGKHSANIYMIHTFLFYYWFSQFIYAPKYAVLIFLLLLGCSLLVSVLLEFIKKKVGVYKLLKYINGKIGM